MEPHEPAKETHPQTTFDHADFYSIVVESSGASPVEMTGTRDVDAQDRELTDIFGIQT